MERIHIDHNILIRKFEEYTRQYGTDNRQIRLRIEHMEHTAQTMLDLASGLGLDYYDTDLAWAIAYLHDLSRLEQFRRNIRIIEFQKYDHAEVGAELLFTEGRIKDFIPDIDKIPAKDVKAMELAVRYHNRLELPDGLTERERLFCYLIRDADKIDIFRVIATSPYEDVYNDSYPDFVSSDFSPEVVEAFEKKSGISTSLVRTPGDLYLLDVAMIFGLHFAKSLALVRKQGYFEKMLDVAFVRPAVREKFADLRNTALSVIGAGAEPRVLS